MRLHDLFTPLLNVDTSEQLPLRRMREAVRSDGSPYVMQSQRVR
jgi:hypothetical protein